ncbi:reverse transcriptase/maturase family protein [Schnuerera sp.]|uniref:reverse transcriptase/maturase family protein n=1 Tax=Schnuerera sp. TaxID=2794844 RepID=UPI002C38E064|nr:reverse transcriptase/maturase family protein [Schnuerera sp.]HSH35333.1 reverse transcriptase/maturase family protein [Schnuerera sp.]
MLRGKSKYTKEAIEFAMDEVYNLLKLKAEIKNKTYRFSGYINFVVTRPKVRGINAPHCRDKVVQLAMNNVLKEIYNPKFIYDSYACIDEKGTHRCVKRIQHFMRKAKWEYGDEAFIVKIDIKKFFYNIVRDILKELIAQTIKEKETLELIYLIIDSADAIDVLGMPLGNTLSQLCANIYLNVVDQYAKRNLGLKYYIRYMDDIIIIVENKERAKEVLELIRAKVEKELGLVLNENKSKIFPLAQGANAIGFKIYPTHMLLRNESKKRIKQKLKKFKPLLIEEEITIEKVEQILNSWLGHADLANSYKFIQSLLERFDYIKLVDKRFKNGKIKKVFKIKREVIDDARKSYISAKAS